MYPWLAQAGVPKKSGAARRGEKMSGRAHNFGGLAKGLNACPIFVITISYETSGSNLFATLSITRPLLFQ
jgi:hypothetical protein